MTYLVPDDWHANHGLAPGDARGPQPRLARLGTNAPLPPLRGYYGRPPMPALRRRHATLSPWAVSDVMYGVHGLGALGAEQTIEQVMERLQRDMKEQMIKQAAINASLSLTLLVIPVVGWAASAALAVVQGIVGTKYQKQAKEVLADIQVRAREITAEYQTKMQEAQNAVFEQEKPAGVQLAVTCQPLNGMGDLGFSLKSAIKAAISPSLYSYKLAAKGVQSVAKRVSPSAGKVVAKLTSPITKADKAVDDAIDIASGRAAVEKAKEARTEILAKVRQQMEAQYQQALQNMMTPQFRANLRAQIAAALRADPNIAKMLGPNCALPGVKASTSMPSGGKLASWAGVAAAALGAVVMLGSHK